MPLTPKQKAAAGRAGSLEPAARAAREREDWASAATDYRAETEVPGYRSPPWVWSDLGLMLDRQGKRNEAFSAYQRGCLSPPGSLETAGSEGAEAAARFGLMCEDRGLHGEACECYYTSRRLWSLGNTTIVGFSVDSKKTSPIGARMLLNVCLGGALEDERFEKGGRWTPDSKANARAARREAIWSQDRTFQALAAFRAAVKLAPDDPRPRIFLADGLRRAGRFAEADAALQDVFRLDASGDLKAAAAKGSELIRQRSLE